MFDSMYGLEKTDEFEPDEDGLDEDRSENEE
jgi:hypothetical protein